MVDVFISMKIYLVRKYAGLAVLLSPAGRSPMDILGKVEKKESATPWF